MLAATPGARPFRRRVSLLTIFGVLASLGLAAAAPAQRGVNAPSAAERIAGRRVIYSYAGMIPPPELLRRIRYGEAAGVIFFSDNISSPSQISAVIEELHRAQMESPVRLPLLLMTDEEGGLVRRVPGQPTLPERAIGRMPDPAAAASRAGLGAGQGLASVGMNVNLAPVLDVVDGNDNFIDKDQRSYGSNPTVVASAGRAFIAAQQTIGVAATAKHFPGLGTAGGDEDTDLRPVTLHDTLSELRSIDEAPYVAAITSGVRLVMVSWATYPALDRRYPAGLSSVVVGSELRARLGFTGVTITDALEAAGLKRFGGTEQRAVLAAAAGMDLILCSGRNVYEGGDATDALASALANGTLDGDAFRASVDRVDALRAELS